MSKIISLAIGVLAFAAISPASAQIPAALQANIACARFAAAWWKTRTIDPGSDAYYEVAYAPETNDCVVFISDDFGPAGAINTTFIYRLVSIIHNRVLAAMYGPTQPPPVGNPLAVYKFQCGIAATQRTCTPKEFLSFASTYMKPPNGMAIPSWWNTTPAIFPVAMGSDRE